MGPFNNTPAYPIVVIGNQVCASIASVKSAQFIQLWMQADPITPFANARAVAIQYGNNARLIEQDDFGVSVALSS